MPWRVALALAMALPRAVLGPVLACALILFALTFLELGICVMKLHPSHQYIDRTIDAVTLLCHTADASQA